MADAPNSKTVPPAQGAGPNTIMTREALRELYCRNNWPKWLIVCLKQKLRSRPDAEHAAIDLMQEVMIQLSTTEAKFIGRPRKEVLKDIKNKALSKAKDYLELHANSETDRFPVFINDNGELETEYDPKKWWADSSLSGTIEAFERVADVRLALQRRLNSQQQQIARLVIDGYGYEDIGKLIGGWSKSNVQRRWKDIEQLLAEHLEIPAANIVDVIRMVVESAYVKESERHHDVATQAASVSAAERLREQGRQEALKL